ncbi:MAG: glycosyltransferase family 4 protein [Pirellulales bacterium]|nr:glycosyltransferase family 4 protein [Pirellulales bacterium]
MSIAIPPKSRERTRTTSRPAVRRADAAPTSPAEPKLKVCMLAACPFPANHGTPGSIRELAEATAERGHEVHVVTYHIGEDLPLRGVHLHRIADWTGEQKIVVGPTKYRPLYDFQMIFKTIQIMRRYGCDLMHAHGYEAALAAGCARPFVRRPIMYSAHNRMGDELASYDFFKSKRLANALAWVLDRTVPRLGNRCLPHSVNLKEFLRERGLNKRMEPVLNFGIDFEDHPRGNRERLRRECGLGDEPIVLYSGVIDQFQRLDLLIGAMAHVLKRLPHAKLLILANVHNAKHEAAIRAEADRLGIGGSVLLRAPTSMEKGLRLLSIADVAVSPRPQTPGFPIKLLNYMAAQRACVLFASSASALAHGENVWLAGDDTSQSLGVAITRVLRDTSLRTRIALGGHHFVRDRHDRRAVAAKLSQAYCRLLQPTRRWAKIVARPTSGSDDSTHESPATNLWDVGMVRPLEVELNARS